MQPPRCEGSRDALQLHGGPARQQIFVHVIQVTAGY
jgi:hypothetical protein